MADAPRFLPIQTGQASFALPGLAPEPGGQAPVLPPGTYPIMAANSVAGDMTGTLMPLADPLPPQMPPLPTEVAMNALPEDALVQGLPQLEMPLPEPPAFPEVPPSADAPLPGMEPLADPLPTTVPFEQRAWPPFLEGYQAPGSALPQVLPPAFPDYPQLPQAQPVTPPLPLDFPAVVGAASPFRDELPMIPLAADTQPPPTPPVPGAEAASLTTFPPLLASAAPALTSTPSPEPAGLPVLTHLEPFAFPQLATPTLAELPAPAVGEPIGAALQSGWDALAALLAGQEDREEKQQRFADERGRLRAPVPGFADGKVLWEKVWGEG